MSSNNDFDLDQNGSNKKRLNSSSSISTTFDDLDEILQDSSAVEAEKFRIMKNLLIICFAFMCNFTAFNGTSSLQSSLNYSDGLGTGSLAIIYGSLILSAMFTPTIVIKRLGCKWTVCVAIVGYTTYSLANFYPHWGTLVPSSIIVGLSAAPLWSAKCTYLTVSAKRYARLTNEKSDNVVNRFFGIFFLFFQFTNIIGQLISSFVLSSEDATNLVFPSCYNETYIETYCGANDCQEDFNVFRRDYNTSECPINELQSGKPTNTLLYTLMGIYAGVALSGMTIMAIFVDNIVVRQKETRGPFDLLVASFKHMKDYRQILLIPITMYSGFEQALLTGDFTRSFVTCPLAVNWVGFVLICYGACDSVFSFVVGRAEKYTGRISLFTTAFLINLALIIVFLVWIPYPSTPALFFVLPALWGVADAVWQTQLNAFYGILFATNQEASFANYRLWESLGFVIAFAYQTFICLSVKLYVTLSVLVIGMLLYYYIEYDVRRSKKNVLPIDSGSTEKWIESTTDEEQASNNNMEKKGRVTKI